MTCPFPGMDPFLEFQEWEDFRATFNATLREFLSPTVEPRYVVRVERRVYVEHFGDESPQSRRADVAILKPEVSDETSSWQTNDSASVAAVECLVVRFTNDVTVRLRCSDVWQLAQ